MYLPSLLPGEPFHPPTAEEFGLPTRETLVRICERMERADRLLPGDPEQAQCRMEYHAIYDLALNLQRSLRHGDRR